MALTVRDEVALGAEQVLLEAEEAQDQERSWEERPGGGGKVRKLHSVHGQPPTGV
jgi:hypothetical protein